MLPTTPSSTCSYSNWGTDVTASAHRPLDLAVILDRLIERYAAVLELQPDENIKIGDFLKLVEIRNKLQPDNTTQGAFWSHLDDIRKSELPDPAKKPTASPRKKAPKKKTRGEKQS